MSYTRLVRLPEGSTLALMLCDSGASGADAPRCLEEARADWGPAGQGDVAIRLGAHAYDDRVTRLPVKKKHACAFLGAHAHDRVGVPCKKERQGIVLSLGAHAYDRSYLQLYLATATCNVSIEACLCVCAPGLAL